MNYDYMEILHLDRTIKDTKRISKTLQALISFISDYDPHETIFITKMLDIGAGLAQSMLKHLNKKDEYKKDTKKVLKDNKAIGLYIEYTKNKENTKYYYFLIWDLRPYHYIFNISDIFEYAVNFYTYLCKNKTKLKKSFFPNN